MAPASALADAHQRRVDLVADVVAREVHTEARRANPADIDTWWKTTGPKIERIVATGWAQTARLGLQQVAEDAVLNGLQLDPVMATLQAAQLATSLLVTGPVAFKRQMARSGNPETAVRTMTAQLVGAATRWTLAGDRDTFFATADANPQVIVGYQRQPEAGACKFCLMLAGRGAVYLSQESAGQVVGQRGQTRGTQKIGRAFHDHCRCKVVPVYGTGPARPRVRQTTPPPPAPAAPAGLVPELPTPTGNAFELIQTAKDRSDLARRRARVQRIKAEAAAERAARLDAERSAAVGTGKVDPAVLRRWNVTEDQYLTARALTKQIKADIRQVAGQEADDLGGWLLDNGLSQISRPDRLRKSTNVLGQTGFRRQAAGYDWLEQLDDAELARIRKRMVDSDIYKPDLLAEQVRRKVEAGADMTDDEAMAWVVDRWLHEDALRSLASGRIPKYADAANLIPGDYALDGYNVELLFGVDDAEAIGHVAQVQAEAARSYATRALGRPSNGPAPWELDAVDYVGELDEVERILTDTQLAPGIDPGPEYRWAQARIKELAPPDIDDGTMAPNELYEQIRVTAQLAGLLAV